MKGAGIPGAEGPAGVHPRATLDAFARVVVDEVPARLLPRLIRRLGEELRLADAEASDRSSTGEGRERARVRAAGYARAALALERAWSEAEPGSEAWCKR